MSFRADRSGRGAVHRVFLDENSHERADSFTRVPSVKDFKVDPVESS